MAFAMPPPKAPGFSLRVQLFAPNAYGPEDKPTRSFRVVIDPEASVQEFCQEASRIHEVNYGQPIAIKRCQDDQGFDITQTEVIQDLFVSMNTIRLVQAAAIPSMRDSVPPTSALRFDPSSLLGKRDRAKFSPKANGINPSSSYQPHKRQRVSDPDPDQPLASLEEEPEQDDNNIVPNSQESIILGEQAGSSYRQVRPENSRVSIPATPSPPPSIKSETSTDTFSYKFADKRSNLPDEIRESSPASRAQQRSKSKSLGITGSQERDISATGRSASPVIGELSLPTNGFLFNGRKPSAEVLTPRRSNGRAAAAVRESIYDVIESADESATISKIKKAALKRNQNSPANAQFNTPPIIRHRAQSDTTPKELALTPQSSKQQQKQKDEANEARKARLAAAEAAEQRKRQADEARLAEEARRVEEERIEREEIDRAEAEESRRIETERVAKEQRDREEEAQRVAEHKSLTERLEREAEEEANARIASSPPEDPRRQVTSSPAIPRAASTPRTQSTTPFIPTGRKSSLKTPSINGSSPAPRGISSNGVGINDNMPMSITKSPRRVSFVDEENDTPVRPLLKSLFAKKPSTPHPSAKNRSKNPSTTPDILPPKAITPTSIPNQSRSKSITPSMSAPKTTTPLSANDRSSKSKTPDILPKKAITPQTAPSKPQAILPASRSSSGLILPPPRVYSAIVPPPRLYNVPSADRSFSPQVPLQVGKASTPIPPHATGKGITPGSRTSTPVPPPNSQAPPQSSSVQPPVKETVPGTSDEESESEFESESDSEAEAEAGSSKDQEKPVSTLRSPALLAQDSPINTSEKHVGIVESTDEESEEEEIMPPTQALTSPDISPITTNRQIDDQEDVETQSNHSSVRDSRSPIRYNELSEPLDQHTESENEQPTPKVLEKDDSSDDDDEDIEMPDVAIETTAILEDSESEKEDEDITVQIPDSSAHPTSAQKMSPQTSEAKATRSKQTTSKAIISPSGSTDTQNEIDNQLISSMIEASSPPVSQGPKPKTNGNASSPLRPSIGFGASLKGMNEKKKTFSSSAPAVNQKGKNVRTSLLSKLKGAVDEESEDEESNSEDESSDEEPAPVAQSSQPPRSTQLPKKKKNVETEESGSDDSSSESGSESGSGSGNGSEDEEDRARTNLLAQIAELKQKRDSQAFPDSSQSPSLQRDSRARRRVSGE